MVVKVLTGHLAQVAQVAVPVALERTESPTAEQPLVGLVHRPVSMALRQPFPQAVTAALITARQTEVRALPTLATAAMALARTAQRHTPAGLGQAVAQLFFSADKET
jgi:hypothetical protein